MPWFRRKPTPYDENFDLSVVAVPNTPADQTVTYEVPYYWHAQLIAITFTLHTVDPTVANGPHLVGEAFRAEKLMYFWRVSSVLKYPQDGIHGFFTHVYDYKYFSYIPYATHVMTDSIFLYPYDRIIHHFTNAHADDYFTDLVFTMRTWRTG